MKKLVVICLGVLIFVPVAFSSSKAEAFALADCFGEPNARSFFSFSTSAGSYIIRYDGVGEVTLPTGLRRMFYLKLGAKGRIESIYFLEHQGDLFLLYEVHDSTSEWAYVMRMEQQKRKPRWLTALPGSDVQEPVIQGDSVVIKDVQINKADGRIVGQD